MNSFIKNTQITSPFLIHLQFIFFLLMSITSQFPLASHGCQEHERRALLDIKSSLSDPSNRLSSWKEGIQHENCCRWHGIRCSLDTSHIISIDLQNRELKTYYIEDLVGTGPNTTLHGKISPSLSNITHLKYLDLSWNDFYESQIPFQLSHLTKLSHLDFSYSNFSASISTQFANLTSLSYLDLSCIEEDYHSTSCLKISSSKWLRGLENLKVLKLRGIDLSTSQKSFAQHISYLSDLRYLGISRCSISTWVFPLHNLSRLSTLRMSFNPNLSSEIPVQMANLTSLSILDLSYCGLQGSVPYLPQLRELDVSDNSDLRPDLTSMFQHQWPKLQTLSIDGTNVSGSIPVQMANLTSLSFLHLSSCSGLQGLVPYLPQLMDLDVSRNHDLRPDLTSMFQHQWPKLQTLWITNTNVSGPIPDTISNAPSLVSLDAGWCSIQGSIPSSIGKLSRFQSLFLPGNNITGHIPKSICEMSSLQQLYLNDNKISGTIPSCVTKLHNLDDFSVSGNSIGGSVSLINFINELNLTRLDVSLNRLTVVVDQRFHLYSKFKLESLRLSSCNLRGLIPAFICKMSNLTDLDLSQNQLAGVIPFNCFSELQIFNIFNLSNNKFHGPLPLPPQASLTSLFDVSNNKFSGEISTESGKRLSSFGSFNLAGNELSGSIPSSMFQNVSEVKSDLIDLSNNKFSGQIPFSICSREYEYYSIIDLSRNKLSGTIPTSIGYCTSLFSLNLGNNNLTGNVPNELQQMIGMSYLQLNDNNLHGTPLDFISKLQYLQVLNLANNHFGGCIPAAFGLVYYLRILSLRSNNFNGSVPQEINHLEQLQILDLSHNNLSGHIPKLSGKFWRGLVSNTSYEFSYPDDVQLQMVNKGVMIQFKRLYNYSSGIDLSCNMLDGNIPMEIGSLKELATLNLSHNDLSDDIPKSLGNMSSLGSLDLSFNRLSGHIPQSFTLLDSLGVLNLSYNELSGRIPRGNHFETLTVDGWAFVGNDLLCGEPTKKLCDGDQITSTNNTSFTEKDEKDDQEDAKEKIFFYGSIALGFIVGFWGLFFVLLLRKEKWWFAYWRVVNCVAERIIGCIQR